ncbi:hypothetical protein PVAP13_5NG014136 [Panicum virgatum]|uniref:F-box associated beta-propeller type 3 domain-containing protein n=1 Tax=Panicum virgatum TaxID=38727 RepID=A0A8T0RK94_PANVG|nr:hypothetical protein PVAP13_5NG014136 [Panicum virgatum]
MLFGCTREDKFGYIVCNPATEELVTLPASSSSCPLPPPMEESYYITVYDGVDERYAHTFLMFDSAVSSHFHLVQIWDNFSMMKVETVHSYSSETRAWSDRSSKWKQGEWGLQGQAIIKFTNGRALINGLLHFIVYDVQEKEDLIVVVDGEGKTCRIIRWHGKDVATIAFIGQSQDHLQCIGMDVKTAFLNGELEEMSVWVLEDYDTQEWILKHNVSSSQFFGFLSRIVEDFDIVAIHPDHNSIILVQHWDQKLVSYNIDSKELRALCTLGKGYLLLTPYVPCFKESSVLATKD